MTTINIPIQLPRSTTPGHVPTTSQLLVGQLALNMVDFKLYFKDGSNVIQRLGVALSDLAVVATTGSYNDLLDKPTAFNYTLPPATTAVLGGVIVGSGLAVDGSGNLTNAGVISVNTRVGAITLTSTDVGIPTDLLSGPGTTLASKYLPSSLTGALTYQGTWNASTNTPTLASGTGTKGFYYVVNVAGTTNLDGNNSWSVGDYAIFDGTEWSRLANGSAVTSVNGQTGTVTISATSLGLATVATTGSYTDLINKPTPYSLPVATTTSYGGVKVTTTAQTAGNASTGQLATVATSGSYNDLLNLPANPNIAEIAPSVSGNPNVFQEIFRLMDRAVQFPNGFAGSFALGRFITGTVATVNIMKYSPATAASPTQVGTITVNSGAAATFTSVGSVTNFAIGDALSFQFPSTNMSSFATNLLGTWQ